MLENSWRRQLAFTTKAFDVLGPKPLDQLTEDDKVSLTKDYLLSLHSEITEVLNNVPWKRHRYIGASNREALLEELVDVQKFLWGLMQMWDVTPAELERAFDRKSGVVEQRFIQDHELPKLVASKKVVIIDIDGVVCDWDNGFEKWARSVHDLEPEQYAKHVDPVLRQRLKDEIHATGGMKALPALMCSLRSIDLLVKEGYTIVWLTARPVSKHPRVVADTVEWLTFHDLPTEYIYYSDYNKHLFVVEKFPMAAALFDDTPEIVSNAMEFGLPAFLVDGNFSDLVKEFLSGSD
jgi:hypothetical protein